MRVFALLPLKFHYFVGRCIAWIVAVPMHYRRDVVMINIARSFPEKKYGELVQMAKNFYRHFGDIVAETFSLPVVSISGVFTNHIYVKWRMRRCWTVCSRSARAC